MGTMHGTELPAADLGATGDHSWTMIRLCLAVALVPIGCGHACPEGACKPGAPFVDAGGARPPDWFLSPAEIVEARGGCARNTVRPYVLRGNSAELLVNGDEVFAQLYDDLTATAAGDFIWMTAWDINGGVMLRPDYQHPERSQDTRIDRVLLAAIARGVELRMLININAMSPVAAVDPITFCHPFNEAASRKRGNSTIVCAPDQRHNSDVGSLHQKSWVVKRSGETVAYVGSMDVSAGRYDTRKHDQDANWKIQPTFTQGYYGWTGGMLRVKGQSVIDIAHHLFDEWSDPAEPFPDYRLAPVTWTEPPVGAYSDPTQLQVLLSAGPRGACGHGYYCNFAPHGETTVLAATLKAIGRASQYIYMSDQFMWYPPIMNALAARMAQVPGLRVLLLTDSAFALDHLILGYDLAAIRETKFYYQWQTWAPLAGMRPRLSAYHLIKEGLPAPTRKDIAAVHNIIYSHWKVVLVDDQLAIIGSAGIEQSGMTNDVDMSVSVYDPAAVNRFRKALWSDHLGLAPDDPTLDDPIHAIEAVWPAVAGQNGRARAYWPEDVEHHLDYRAIFDLFEPCGLIDSSRCQ